MNLFTAIAILILAPRLTAAQWTAKTFKDEMDDKVSEITLTRAVQSADDAAGTLSVGCTDGRTLIVVGLGDKIADWGYARGRTPVRYRFDTLQASTRRLGAHQRRRRGWNR